MNKKRFTEKDLKQLKQKGMIKDYKHYARNRNLNPGTAYALINVSTRSREKDWIELNLQYWCNEKVVTLDRELKFSPDRKFRFDWAVPAFKIAIEYEGGIFMEKSGHNTGTHFTKDTDKYNLAQQLGWKVLRFTVLNYKNLIQQLNQSL
jgi:very-short-patch-repair endonuclease